MTGSWMFLTCIHDVQEGLDRHDCLECQEIARKEGKDCSGGKTWIYPKSDKVERSENGKDSNRG